MTEVSCVCGVRYAVVMAAGKGTRMKSELPKVLYPVCGRPMIEYVLDAIEPIVQHIIVVVGYRSDLVREALSSRANLQFVEQTEQLGTGHAVMVCNKLLNNHNGAVLVVAGDCPMIQTDTIKKLFNTYDESENQSQKISVLGTATKENPTGLGRIIRNENNEFIGIVEERDATPEQKLIKEVNMSYYVFHTPDLLTALNELKADNSQKEYYITDTPAILKNKGKKIIALPILKPVETLGINTVEEANIVENALRNLAPDEMRR